MFLGQVADARPGFRRQGADVVAEDAALAAGRLEQPQQHADGGGFAGTVAAQKRKHAAARHLQVQVVHGRLGAEIPGQTPRVNDGLFIHDCFSPFAFPLTKFLLKRLPQLLRREIHHHRLADGRIHQRLQPPPALLAREHLAFAGDEHPAAGPGFDQPFPRQVGVGAGDGVGIDDQPLRQRANARQLVAHRQLAGGDRQAHLIGDLFVDRRVRPGVDVEVNHRHGCILY